MPRLTKPELRLAVLVSANSHYGREIIRGIAAFTREVPCPWILATEPWHFSDDTHISYASKRDGVIAIESRAAMRGVSVARRIPWVAVAESYGGHGVRVVPDDQAIGALAAAHLLSCGFQHFAICGYSDLRFSTQREAGFRRVIEQAGGATATYAPTRPAARRRTRAQDQHAVKSWLEGLPKPVGLFACNDMRAVHICEHCRCVGIHVPQDVAIVGVDNDTLACEFTNPPLSSVDVNAFRIGHEAAALMHRWLQERRCPRRVQRIKPAGLVRRESSDTFASEDPMLDEAFLFLRARACDGITVADILRAVPVARRTFERASQRLLGHSPLAEIRRIQLERAKHLLEHTRMTMAEIAEASGLSSANYLGEVFRKHLQTSPNAYRRSAHCRTRLPGARSGSRVPPISRNPAGWSAR